MVKCACYVVGLDLASIRTGTAHGRRLWHCRECNKEVPAAQHVTGREPSPYTGETIFWDYLVGECGHVVRDDSH